MTLHNFIFTKAAPGKYYRHIAFWLSRVILQSIGVGYLLSTKPLWSFFISQFTYRSVVVLLEIIFTYPVVYYFIPAYFNTNQYLKFSLATLSLALLTYFIFCFYVLDINNLPDNQRIVAWWHYSMFFISESVLAGCAIFLTLKIFKDYYRKMEEKAILAKENADAELQLLKAQVHPHFLFNTINNIYAFILTKPAVAEELVSKLSDTLRYMIKDCDTALVPLEKELTMLQDYITLEKVRYGERLNITINITGSSKNKMITPLVMIPFAENSFKHGTSRMLEKPWIELDIHIDDKMMNFRLLNGKPVSEKKLSNGKSGIGINNITKRLELLYPNGHQLQINNDTHTFSVMLNIPIFDNRLQDSKNEDSILKSIPGKTEFKFVEI